MALVAVAVSNWLVRAGLWAVLGFSLYHAWYLHVRRTAPRAIDELTVDSEGTVSVKFHGETDWRQSEIISRFVHPWVVILSLRIDGWRWPVKLVIAADAAEADAFRRLRVRLKLQSAVA